MADDPSTRRLRADVRLLGDILGEVLRVQGGGRAFDLEERMRALAKMARGGSREAGEELARMAASLDLAEALPVLRAFTSYFELVNTAEQLHRVRIVRQRRGRAYPQPHGESVGEAVRWLTKHGLSREETGTLLEGLRVEPVFTAHPTQAKRAVVLALLRRVEFLLQEREVRDLTPAEEETLREALREEVSILWESRIVPEHRPSVEDEVESGLYFLRETVWQELPGLYRDLTRALEGEYPGLEELPWRPITFGTWIGGDRDGNRSVTAGTTREALRRQALAASRLYAEACLNLQDRLALARPLAELPERLREWVDGGSHPGEPYRELFARLARAWRDWEVRLLDGSSLPPGLGEFTQTFGGLLEAAQASLAEVSRPAAAGGLANLVSAARAFGPVLASLDVRQDAGWHRQALEELLGPHPDVEAALRDGPDGRVGEPGERAGETLDTLRVMGEAQASLGAGACHVYLISRVQAVGDVLAVLLLRDLAGAPAELDVVPLIEDVDSLYRAGELLTSLFAHPLYRRHLAGRGHRQQVQVGYSDSNKDGGYLAANWALFRAQQAMVDAARAAAVHLTVFHGRGGTIGRGGGPANRAILALPPGVVQGTLRLTEQGEIIAERYANPAIAHRHLEQLVNAVIKASVPGAQPEPEPGWVERMDDLAARALRAYRSLVYERPEFLTYFEQATPIAEIETLVLGSRPARREDQGGRDIESLRAIPWVFAWVQSRHLLPAWYGLGAALKPCLDGAALEELRTMYHRWPFFATVIDNAQLGMAQADLGIARAYAGLVEDVRLAGEVFGLIEADYRAAREAILAITGQDELLDNEPEIRRSVALRNPYVDPLSHLQVALLRRWRALPPEERPADLGEAVPPLLGAIHLSINGIAAGLRGTG